MMHRRGWCMTQNNDSPLLAEVMVDQLLLRTAENKKGFVAFWLMDGLFWYHH